MPLDSFAVAALKEEFNQKLAGGKIEKIYQPEKDELLLLILSKGKNYRLIISAECSNPRMQITP